MKTISIFYGQKTIIKIIKHKSSFFVTIQNPKNSTMLKRDTIEEAKQTFNELKEGL